jgi:hypothetical protein
MTQDSPSVMVAPVSPYKPYVAGLLALICVMVTAQAMLLHQDVRKCDNFHANLSNRFNSLPNEVEPEEIVKAKERIAKILQSDPVGCKNVGAAFNGVIEKCMTILFSLITGASIAATSMTTLQRPVPYRGPEER